MSSFKDYGELEAYKAAGGEFYKPYQKTYEDVEHEQLLQELKEEEKLKNEWKTKQKTT